MNTYEVMKYKTNWCTGNPIGFFFRKMYIRIQLCTYMMKLLVNIQAFSLKSVSYNSAVIS